MERTVLRIPKMDCASEERLVRMALQSLPVQHLDFDLGNRRVTVFHDSTPERIVTQLAPLDFGAEVAESGEIERDRIPPATSASSDGEQRVLIALLMINAAMFVVELTAGWLAESTGLLADALDMFADAAVYGVSLYSVGKAATMQKGAARLSGYLQLTLAVFALAEVARRLLFGSEPEPPTMIGVAFLALAANVFCLVLISKYRGGGAHMRASWIFSTNDVIANIGVIVAAGLVAWTGSAIPDLIVGTGIAIVVLSGALRILKLSRG